MKVTAEDRKHLKKTLAGMTKRKTKRAIFYDLCFCLCAPQTTFKSNTKVIKELKESGFYEKPTDLFMGTFKKEKNWLKETLKPVRFYNNKAKYLIDAKLNFEKILYAVRKKVKEDSCGYFKREYLVKNVKGMGMKAASHFLRNQGYDALAIIDTHIIKFLANHDTAGYQNYSASEECLRKQAATFDGYEDLEIWFQTIAGHMNLTTAELDALIWKQASGTAWKEFKY